jgi:cytochrome c-type biogenesis protein CcsB
VTPVEALLVWSAVAAFCAGFVLELLGLVNRREHLQRVAFGATLGALALLTGAAAARWAAVGHGPVQRTFENSLAASWFLVVVFLGIARGVPRVRALLVGVLPVVVLMLGNGIMSRPEHEPLLPPYRSGWLWVHVSFAWLAYGSFLVAAALGVVYLRKAREATPPAADQRLPAAPVLDELALKAIIFGFVSHTVMMAAGAIWAHGLWGRYWSWDPVETWSLISWVIYGLYLHLRVTFGWRGRRATWLAVAAAAAVIVTFGGMGFTAGIHTRLL